MVSLLPNTQTINEAQALLNGHDVACGPTAVYIAAAILNGFRVTQSGLQSLVTKAGNAGTLDYSGQNPGGIQWDFDQYGIDATFVPYSSQNQLESTLDSALSSNKPVVLGLSNGSQLTGETPSLRGHFVTVVGEDPATGKYAISDPNLGQVTLNSGTQIADSEPFAIAVPGYGASGLPTTTELTDSLSNPITGITSDIISTGLTDYTNNIYSQVKKSVFGGQNFNQWFLHETIRTSVAIAGAIIFFLSLNKLLDNANPGGSVTDLVRGPLTNPAIDEFNKTKQATTEALKTAGEAAIVA